MEINKNFLNKELSLKFRELGFNECCFAYYSKDNLVFTENPLQNTNRQWTKADYLSTFRDNNQSTYCTAPLYQQIIDFLLEKYELDIDVSIAFRGEKNKGYACNIFMNETVIQLTDQDNMIKYYDTKYKALEEGFNKAIELIKNGIK